MTVVLTPLLSAIVSPVMMGGIAVGGIIVLAFLWGVKK
jgi:nitrogen fixation-related uncharacterized protein